MKSKKAVGIILSLALIGSVLPTGTADSQAAAKKPTMAKTKKVTVGKTVKLKVKKGKYKIKSIKWTSSKRKVATVNKKGTVKGLKVGKTVIKAVVKTKKTRKNKSKKFSLKCKVTVVAASPAATTEPTTAPQNTEKPGATGAPTLTKDDYTLKWEDEFEGTELNRKDWNVELHPKGWVNEELQEYVDSPDNIEVKDGKLILKPKKTGTKTYTSGRVNTQKKHDFKYGIFEAKIKFPKGQGYLPAFWMMPTNESLYGQWPVCGEIDIAEVMGQETNKLYGTIHYGKPHKETQGTYLTETGTKDFSDDYHIFDVEWVPGRITWYVDGVKYHETRDWYSAEEGDDPLTFPAPFDQNFYMILNLAVGGSWVGDTNDATDADMANQSMSVDYVRAYQKDSYDENVVAVPDNADATLRDPDANGNYIVNGDFAKDEDLKEDKDWAFKTALEGEASATIADHKIVIKTTKEGTADYSVQLVQNNLPMKKNASYQLSFDAKASEARKMKVSIKGPDQGWLEYMKEETVGLTTEMKTYTYNFTDTVLTDPNGRLDFNMGKAGSTADIEITNVVLKKTAEDVKQEKTVKPDGNYIYNGKFDQGEGRLGYWEILKKDKPYISVTNENNERRLKITAPDTTTKMKPVTIEQSELGLLQKGQYLLSYKAYKEGAAGDDRSIQISYGNKDFTPQVITSKETKYEDTFELKDTLDRSHANFSIRITAPGTYYIDDVRLEDNALIKNGSFNAGLTSWQTYINSPADATSVVDSLSESNAYDITINDTGSDTDNWYIQLIQDGIPIEKGKKYKLSFRAKSSLNRKIQYQIGHNGVSDDDWTSYSDYQVVDLTSDYKTYEVTFTMNNETDLKSRFSITMGSIDSRITKQHRICIDDVVLEEL